MGLRGVSGHNVKQRSNRCAPAGSGRAVPVSRSISSSATAGRQPPGIASDPSQPRFGELSKLASPAGSVPWSSSRKSSAGSYHPQVSSQVLNRYLQAEGDISDTPEAMSDRMTGLGHHTVEVCNKILKRIWAELETTDEQTAISNLMAWLNCCQIETELLEAEEQLDEISQQYLLTYRNKLNGRNYLGSAARGPAHATAAPSSPARAVNASADWLGPLDDSSSRLLRSTIVPETSPSWRDKLDSPQFKEVMDKLYSWDDFNIFTLTELTDGHPLEVVATQIINDLDLPKQLNLDMDKFRNFVQAVELTYRAENSYHNNIHAADVTQSLAVLLSYEEMRSQLTPMEHLAMVLAAVTHDIGHPGLNNDFLVNSKSEEAKIYHDQSVNENMHLRYAFKLLEKPDTNFIANLNSKDYWFLRQALIKLVLSTDMAVHPRLLAEFENHIAMLGPDLSKWGHSDRMCALAMFVHCADIANPAKPGPFARAWTFRVMEEFYSQGDKEKELNIPQSPGCIRGMVNVPKSQMTFLKYCVRPSYEALAHLFPEVAKTPLSHLDTSIAYWNSRIDSQQASENGVAGGTPAKQSSNLGGDEQPPSSKVQKVQ